jgi:dihydroorotase
MVGLESALSVVQASVIDTGHLDWNDVARVFSRVPAEIGLVPGYEFGIAVGSPADFTLYDPAASRVFGVEHLRGKGVNSPYLSATLPGRVVATIHNGYATVLDGELVDAESVEQSARRTSGAQHG